jgi:hypothetical protein
VTFSIFVSQHIFCNTTSSNKNRGGDAEGSLFVPAIGRDHAPVGLRSFIDDGVDRGNIGVGTATDHCISSRVSRDHQETHPARRFAEKLLGWIPSLF